ncbi:hypothetical protein RB195_018351 [Necator americanus]|uniref:Uncharacterized protein n=1 Tax=Necator americanus TaxID=51031 RepID=A0ABR1CCA0_NECAM
MPVVDPNRQQSQVGVYLSAIRPIMMYGSETWSAPSTVIARNESCLDGCLTTFGLGRWTDPLVQWVLMSLSGSIWKKPPGRKRKFWAEVMKEDLRTLGVNRQFRRDEEYAPSASKSEHIKLAREKPKGKCLPFLNMAPQTVRTKRNGIKAVLMSAAIRRCLRRADLDSSVSVVEVPPNNLKRQLVRNRLYDTICTTPNCIICPTDSVRTQKQHTSAQINRRRRSHNSYEVRNSTDWLDRDHATSTTTTTLSTTSIATSVAKPPEGTGSTTSTNADNSTTPSSFTLMETTIVNPTTYARSKSPRAASTAANAWETLPED